MKKLLSFLLIFCLLLSAVGCATQSSSTDADAGETISFVDQAGREIEMSAHAQTIVSGYYISTSMLIALGLADNIVAIEDKADTRPIYELAAPMLLELPNVGTAKEFNLEVCVALEPDLVILPVSLVDTADTLAELGITAICINPESTDLLYMAIATISQATGASESARTLIQYIDNNFGALDELLAETETRTVYLGGNSSFLNTAGEAMYQHYMIEAAGGENVASEIDDSYWATISYEQLLGYDPEVIVIAPSASYSAEDVLAMSELASLSAVENGNVFEMPSDIEAWDSPMPASFLGSYWLCSVLHPEIVSEADFAEKLSYFYYTFYGFTC